MVSIEIQTLLFQHKYIRTRFLQLLKEIEDSGKESDALHFRLKTGSSERAHIGWQMLHCAATYDRYLNIRLLEKEVKDRELVENYASGSTPTASIRVSPELIKTKLLETTSAYYNYFSNLKIEDLDEFPHPRIDRTYRDILMILNWHEAEHMGQCQITWNSFKALQSI